MKFFKSKQVLILGGLGFIGSNLAIKLVDMGANVTILDNLLPRHGGNPHNIFPIKDKCKVDISDLRDTSSLPDMVKNKDIIFDMVGQVSHIDSMKDPFTDLEINCKSKINLLETCREHNSNAKIIFASTRQIYGRPEYLPVDELHRINPVDINGIHKAAAENYFSLYSTIYNMNCIGLRLTNTYGPRQYIQGDSQGFVGIFLRLALQNKKITMYGDGKQIRDFNYIDDVVEAFLLAAKTPKINNGVYNIGHHIKYSLLDFVKTLQKFIEVEYEYKSFPENKKNIDIGNYYTNYSAFKEKTSWSPKVDLEEGLMKTVKYFQDNLSYYLS